MKKQTTKTADLSKQTEQIKSTLYRNNVYLILNHCRKTAKKQLAIFDKIILDAFHNECALFCLEKNIFVIPTAELILYAVKHMNEIKPQIPIYDKNKIAKHYKKFPYEKTSANVEMSQLEYII